MTLALCLASLMSAPARAFAHPIDEYVQSSYLTVAADSVLVEVDLAAGMALGAGLLALIDTDHDGRISNAEEEAYAAGVVRDLSLTIDGGRMHLKLTGGDWPSVRDLLAGTGVIHLFIVARDIPASVGRHHLVYRNAHAPLTSVYLANTFVPEAPVAIRSQERDWYQREIQVDYGISRQSPFAAAWLPLVVLGGLVAGGCGAIVLARRRRARRPVPDERVRG